MTQILTTEEIESFVINRTGSLDDMIRDVEAAVLAKLACGQELIPNSPGFIAAYTEVCKDKAPDHNGIGLAYFSAGWRAKQAQITSGQDPVAIRPFPKKGAP